MGVASFSQRSLFSALGAPLQAIAFNFSQFQRPVSKALPFPSGWTSRVRDFPPGGQYIRVDAAGKTAGQPNTFRRVRRPDLCNASQSTTAPVLKVLKEFEAGTRAAHPTRMVLSGRIADVCAELERMAGPDV